MISTVKRNGIESTKSEGKRVAILKRLSRKGLPEKVICEQRSKGGSGQSHGSWRGGGANKPKCLR